MAAIDDGGMFGDGFEELPPEEEEEEDDSIPNVLYLFTKQARREELQEELASGNGLQYLNMQNYVCMGLGRGVS